MVIKSKEYYDQIASDYNNLLLKKDLYLRAIEHEIFKNKDINTYLDIACGDGTRSFRIIDHMNPEIAVLIDESEQMIQKARLNTNSKLKLLNIDFFDYQTDTSFDMITCLWNVFGHIPNKKMRLEFLIKIKSLMDINGVLFIDINNRYNVNYYGFRNVSLNIIKSFLKIKDVGTFSLKLLNGATSKVYIHKPNEFDELLNLAGLQIIEKKYFDYNTGVEVDSYWKGQILYKLAKKKDIWST